MNKIIYFTVTNDLVYDQRMQRICNTLSAAGYNVTLVGRKLKSSPLLTTTNYRQKRLRCLFNKGLLFYAEYNIRLFFYLLFKKMDAIGAIDLDTILPCYIISVVKRTKRVYDAHELFTEMKEIKTRKTVYAIWKTIEKIMVPGYKQGYTVCNSIARELNNRYGVQYKIVRNLPVGKDINYTNTPEKVFIYTGAVNEGRGFEILIPAMQYVKYPLVICGNGNYMSAVQELVIKYNVQDKVIFKGMLLPAQLNQELSRSYIGINLIENLGLNQYYSLANKFFDYIQMGVPQISMNYPEYRQINEEFNIAVLINHLDVYELSAAMNNLMEDVVVYENLKKNCFVARNKLTWQQEENKIIDFYHQLFNN